MKWPPDRLWLEPECEPDPRPPAASFTQGWGEKDPGPMDPGPQPSSHWGPAWFPWVGRSRLSPGALLTLVRLRFCPGCRGLTSGLYPHGEPQRPWCHAGQTSQELGLQRDE